MNEVLSVLTHINWVDWIIIIVSIIFALNGLKQGFILGAIALIIWVMGALIAYFSAGVLAKKFPELNDSANLRFWIFFISIIIIIWIISKLISWLMPSSSKGEASGFIDKAFGLILSLIKAIFILGLVFGVLNTFPVVRDSSNWHDSRLTPYLLKTSSWIYTDLPEKANSEKKILLNN